MRRARRLRLRVDHDAALLRLTVPWRTSAERALTWAAGHGEWVAEQMERAPLARPFADGATIPFEGRELTIRHRPDLRRGVTLAGDELVVGGPSESLPASVSRWLRAEARERLSMETAAAAAAAGVTVRAVAIGDAVSRWGSCSSNGTIRYNWRLILAPPELLRFVVVHEVAHRVHMNHGPEFKALEARLLGTSPAAARLELRRLGPALRAVGRA